MRWGFEGWHGHDSEAWSALRTEAYDRLQAAPKVTLLLAETRLGAQTNVRRSLRAAGLQI
jgi:23S rRNA (guanine2445-N2)-methyltransferase / 23S rRNA (guanine2069-N7)-methyltransferase